MYTSRKFIFIFFVLTSLLAVGSAKNLFFWGRQILDPEGNNGGGNADVTSDTGSQVSTTSQPPSTTDSQTSIPSTTSDVSSNPISTPTTSSSTPTETSTSAAVTSTIPNTTPGASTQVVVVKTTVIGDSSVAVTKTQPAGSSATNDLASQSNSGGSSGMTQQQKQVAIGVGVGVGGAILLGGLAVVAWRMWGRKKHNPEEDHFLMNDPVAEKPMSPSTTASPFKSTLDQYHNPAGRLNTASNF